MGALRGQGLTVLLVAGAVLILLGVLGLLSVLDIGDVASIILLVLGIVLVLFDRRRMFSA